METVTLNDGTVFNGRCLESEGTLWVYLDGVSMVYGYPYLSDADKTNSIHTVQFGEEKDYTGYNHLFCIREEYGGMLSAGLKKV